MKSLSITRTASKELHAIWEYIAADSLDQADRVVAVIEDEMYKLCASPGMGHERRDVPNSSFRFWKVYSYVIAYRVKGNTLFVSRVVHGAQDFRKLFKPRR